MSSNKQFLDKNDVPKMGLNNRICEFPEYYCKSKQVYLTSLDVKDKKCLCKPTADMIGYRKCNWLEKLDD